MGSRCNLSADIGGSKADSVGDYMSYEKRREKEFKKFVRQCRIELEEARHEVFKKELERSKNGKRVSQELRFYDAGLAQGLILIKKIEKML